MEISWPAAFKLYAPYIALAVINIVGGIYALGYRNGMREILSAAQDSAEQVTHGGN